MWCKLSSKFIIWKNSINFSHILSDLFFLRIRAKKSKLVQCLTFLLHQFQSIPTVKKFGEGKKFGCIYYTWTHHGGWQMILRSFLVSPKRVRRRCILWYNDHLLQLNLRNCPQINADDTWNASKRSLPIKGVSSLLSHGWSFLYFVVNLLVIVGKPSF